VTVEGCAYLGSGNVLIVQKMLNLINGSGDEDAEGQQPPAENNKPAANKNANKLFPYQEVAVIAIALVASSEDIGNEMVLRTMNHILQYQEEPHVRRAVPLAMALLNISNPRLAVMATLMKLANDPDPELSLRSIISLGLIGAGTNNSRLGDCLKQLAAHFYLHKKDNQKFVTRIT
jgi:26S proteasome regulatory subunit N1